MIPRAEGCFFCGHKIAKTLTVKDCSLVVCAGCLKEIKGQLVKERTLTDADWAKLFDDFYPMTAEQIRTEASRALNHTAVDKAKDVYRYVHLWLTRDKERREAGAYGGQAGTRDVSKFAPWANRASDKMSRTP